MTLETATATLSEYDFIVCIDASGSMGETDMPGGRSRWDYMQETALSFTRDICKLDSDGIGVIMFSGGNITSQDNCDVEAVRSIFTNRSPRGSTPLAEALQAAVKLAGKSDKKDCVLVFTDGVPDDKEAAAQVIKRQAASQQTDDEFTFLFIQVGHDAGAAAYLHKLDDELTGAKFDIVCAKTIEEANAFPSTAELVIHAINN